VALAAASVAFAAVPDSGRAVTVETTAASQPSALSSLSATSDVVVPRGQPVQFAFTADTTEGPFFAEITASAEDAIQMAIEQHPTIRGFPVQVNDVETSCSGDNTFSATTIVSNTQNTAVLGNICSLGMVSALPIYQAAGVVTISGSATASYLPPLGPTVFNRTVVVSDAAGDAGDIWASQVATLPSVLEWEQEFEAEFGMAPFFEPYPATYFDAASLLLSRLQQVSRIVNGNLVINRAALASAVRNTTKFQGVSCTITLDPSTGNRVNDPASLARCAEN
jgi:ABC-type branched-subunit amino acid transport system substrate-binding protein